MSLKEIFVAVRSLFNSFIVYKKGQNYLQNISKHKLTYSCEEICILKNDRHFSPLRVLNDTKKTICKADICCSELEMLWKPSSIHKLSGCRGTGKLVCQHKKSEQNSTLDVSFFGLHLK